jgi:hypothetical protein
MVLWKGYAVAMSPDGALIAAGGHTRSLESDMQEQIYLFDRKTGSLVHRIAGLPAAMLHLAFSQDGGRLVAILANDGMRLYKADWAEIALVTRSMQTAASVRTSRPLDLARALAIAGCKPERPRLRPCDDA